jgi:hypothetical protein
VPKPTSDTPSEPTEPTDPTDPTEPTDPMAPPVSSNYYTFRSGIVTGISERTDVSTLLARITVTGGTARVMNSSGNVRSTGAVVTGDRVQILNGSGAVAATYTVVLYGDIDADGSISLVDLLRVQKHLLETTPLTGCGFWQTGIRKRTPRRLRPRACALHRRE